MPSDAIGQVNRVLMHLEVDVVSRLDKVAHEAWVVIVFCSFQSVRVSAGRYIGGPRREGLVLENGGKFAHVQPVYRAEIEVLIAETQKQLVVPNGARALADDGPEALIGRGSEGLERRIIDESDAGRGRSNGQLRYLDANSFINWRESSHEIVLEVSLMTEGREQHRLLRIRCPTECKRAIHLRD